MYLVSYKISTPEIQEKFINSLNELGESVALYPNTRILDSTANFNDIFNDLFNTIEPSDQILIIPFQLDGIQGYVNNNVLGWMRDHSRSDKS